MSDTEFGSKTDDDLYVNEGSSYDDQLGATYDTEPKERQEEEQREKAAKAASYPILPEIADWFEGQVAACEHINNVETKSLTINGVKYSRTVSIEAQVLAYQLLREMMLAKYDEFKEFAGNVDA